MRRPPIPGGIEGIIRSLITHSCRASRRTFGQWRSVRAQFDWLLGLGRALGRTSIALRVASLRPGRMGYCADAGGVSCSPPLAST